MNQQKTLIGIDVGGTKIHAGLYFAKDFAMIDEKRIATPVEEGFEEILYQVTQLALDLRGKDTVGVGIGFPGYLNGHTGMLYSSPNLPLEAPMNLLEYFRGKLDLPVAVENDAKLFTLAEYELNWKHKAKNLVGLTLGTGLGGAMILNGQLYRGRDGFAGEFGHAELNAHHQFEDYVSGKGKPQELGKYLGILLTNIIQILNPEVIILGGSVSKDFEKIEKQVWKEIKAHTVPQSHDGLVIEVSKTQNAGTVGAALLAGL